MVIVTVGAANVTAMLAMPPPPPPKDPRPVDVSVSDPSDISVDPAIISDWLLDAEEAVSTCLTGIDVMLRLASKHGIVPADLLQECKSRLVCDDCD